MKDGQGAIGLKSLIAVALCFQQPLTVWAVDAGSLRSETASLDTVQVGNPETMTESSGFRNKTLYGSVKQHDVHLDDTYTNGASRSLPREGTVTDNDAGLQPENASNGVADLYALAVKKLSEGFELSSGEYRSLGAGCIGYDSDRTFFHKIARVTAVYAGSPAEKAGICVGDRIIDTANDDDARANPQQERWAVTCGQAGTPADVTVLRQGQPVTMTLIRMNIEDIQEPGTRHMWEKVIRELGYPTQGTFTGTSLNHLGR